MSCFNSLRDDCSARPKVALPADAIRYWLLYTKAPGVTTVFFRSFGDSPGREKKRPSGRQIRPQGRCPTVKTVRVPRGPGPGSRPGDDQEEDPRPALAVEAAGGDALRLG